MRDSFALETGATNKLRRLTKQLTIIIALHQLDLVPLATNWIAFHHTRTLQFIAKTSFCQLARVVHFAPFCLPELGGAAAR